RLVDSKRTAERRISGGPGRACEPHHFGASLVILLNTVADLARAVGPAADAALRRSLRIDEPRSAAVTRVGAR
ncbi:MAG: hypothetical protein ACJ8AO_22315, partial [Gemmatimonadaceae bacterium]